MQTKYALSLFAALVLLTTSIQAQKRFPRPAATQVSGTAASAKLPEFSLSPAEVEAHTRFLASDELQGRRTGEPGNAVAGPVHCRAVSVTGAKTSQRRKLFAAYQSGKSESCQFGYDDIGNRHPASG